MFAVAVTVTAACTINEHPKLYGPAQEVAEEITAGAHDGDAVAVMGDCEELSVRLRVALVERD